jgi:hypothetical protein
MSTDRPASSPPTAAPAPKKPRSPLEKVVVRGGILLLLLLVAVQAHARFGYEMSLKKLQARIAEDETNVDGKPLLVSELPQCIVGWPCRTVEKDRHWERVTYSWRGLTQCFEIRMPYDSSDEHPAVMSLETNGAPQPVEAPPPSEESVASNEGGSPTTAHAGMGGPGMGGPGMGGGMGGVPRPDIMTNDADGDGKVSKTEAPERMAQFFDRMDTNSDGFIDAEEAAAARARRAQREGGGGPSAEGRPQPAASGDAPAEQPVPEAKAEGAPVDATDVTPKTE